MRGQIIPVGDAKVGDEGGEGVLGRGWGVALNFEDGRGAGAEWSDGIGDGKQQLIGIGGEQGVSFAQAHGEVEENLAGAANLVFAAHCHAGEGIGTKDDMAAAEDVGEFLGEALEGGGNLGFGKEHDLKIDGGSSQGQRRAEGFGVGWSKVAEDENEVDVRLGPQAAFGGTAEQDGGAEVIPKCLSCAANEMLQNVRGRSRKALW